MDWDSAISQTSRTKGRVYSQKHRCLSNRFTNSNSTSNTLLWAMWLGTISQAIASLRYRSRVRQRRPSTRKFQAITSHSMRMQNQWTGASSTTICLPGVSHSLDLIIRPLSSRISCIHRPLSRCLKWLSNHPIIYLVMLNNSKWSVDPSECYHK